MVTAADHSGKRKCIKRLLLAMLLIALLSNISQSYGQRKPPLEYQVKAAFLFNFTKFITWPSNAFKSAEAPFVIGIIGVDPFGDYLDELVKDEKLDTHPIIIQRFDDISDVTNCHILYINTPQALQQQILLSKLTSGTLTVSDAGGFTKHGGNISFFKQDNKIRLEINVVAAKNARLDISSKLLSIAKLN
jgi:hypothetical protein